MAFTQIGYLGRTGPVFEQPDANGKKNILTAANENGVMVLRYKSPLYAEALGLNKDDYTLGTHADNENANGVPAYKEPNSTAFDYFDSNVAAMTKTIAAGAIGSAPATTTTGTTTGGTSTTGTDVIPTNAAPTLMEQVQTFLTNYWWVVALVAVVLLWNPVIAPALGMGKKGKRKSYR